MMRTRAVLRRVPTRRRRPCRVHERCASLSFSLSLSLSLYTYFRVLNSVLYYFASATQFWYLSETVVERSCT